MRAARSKFGLVCASNPCQTFDFLRVERIQLVLVLRLPLMSVPNRPRVAVRQHGAVRRQSDGTYKQMGKKVAIDLDEIHIESERLSIRPFSADDADAVFRCITPSLIRTSP
jgi:hypothetical protein